MASERTLLSVEVVYAMPERQILLVLEVEPGTTVAEAIERSGIRKVLPNVDFTMHPVGIFGKRVGRDAVLRDGDRVEIYRALTADPKASRRERARKTR